jgi:hypothetical protein
MAIINRYCAPFLSLALLHACFIGKKKRFAMKSSRASTVDDRELWRGAAAATAKSTVLLRGGFAICEKQKFEMR